MPSKKPIIAILLAIPFTEQNYERNGIPYLRENFEVVVLDCNSWLRSTDYGRLRFTEQDHPRVITIASADEFEEVTRQLKADYAIDALAYDGSRWIQKTLRKHGTKFVVPSLGRVPVTPIKTRTIGHLSMAVKNPRRLLEKAIAKLSKYLMGRQRLAPDVALLAGRKSLSSYTRWAKTILWVRSMDYYIYRTVQEKSVSQKLCLPFHGRYTLFIDSCTTLSSDLTLLGMSPPVEPEGFYALLRQAFDRLERITGWPVIVAGHPNGKDIENYASFFGERHVYFDNTAELCSQSDLVVTDGSTALSFAVLGGKPLIILTSQLLNKSYQGAFIRELSIQLHCPLLYVDSDYDEYESVYERARVVCKEAYKRYIDNFIMTDDVVEDTPWQAFTDFVNQSG